MHSEPMIAVRDVPASAEWYRTLLDCTNDHVVEPHANPQTGWREFTLRDADGYSVALAEV